MNKQLNLKITQLKTITNN